MVRVAVTESSPEHREGGPIILVHALGVWAMGSARCAFEVWGNCCYRAAPHVMAGSIRHLEILRRLNRRPVNLFHLRGEAAEDDFLDALHRVAADRLYRDLGRLFPGVAVDAGRNSGEGDRLAFAFFGKLEAAAVTRFQQGRFTMLAVPVDRSRSMDDVLRRKPEPGSDFRLARLAAVEGDAGTQEFRTCRPVDGAVDSATPKQGAVRRIHDCIDIQLRDVALDNFYLNHILPPL